MRTHAYKATAWLLIAILAIVAGVGEALHWIPGCGHGVPVGNRIVLLGIALPGAEAPTDGLPHVDRQGQSIPVYDEDQCAICSAVASRFSKSAPVQLILAMPLVHELPALVFYEADSEAPRSFQIRAPPTL